MGNSFDYKTIKSEFGWDNSFKRGFPQPLDMSSIFNSYEDALKYAQGDNSNPDSRGLQGTSYVGQIVTVYENGVVKTYYINEERILTEIGRSGGVFADDEVGFITEISNGETEGLLLCCSFNSNMQVIKKYGYEGPGLYIIKYKRDENNKIMYDEDGIAIRTVIRLISFNDTNDKQVIDAGTY